MMKSDQPEERPAFFEMSGTRFLLFVLLPLLVIFGTIFIAFAPDQPLGGPTKLRPPAEAPATDGESAGDAPDGN